MSKNSTAADADQDLTHGGYGLHVFDDVPGHLIRCARQIAVAIFLEELAPFNVTSVQYAALVAIRANPGVDQRTLGDLIAIDRSTIGTLLGRLEEAELVDRRSPSHNQRIKQVQLTPQGVRLLDESSEAISRVQSRIMAPLNIAEQGQLLSLLGRLVEGNMELSRAPLKAKPIGRKKAER